METTLYCRTRDCGNLVLRELGGDTEERRCDQCMTQVWAVKFVHGPRDVRLYEVTYVGDDLEDGDTCFPEQCPDCGSPRFELHNVATRPRIRCCGDPAIDHPGCGVSFALRQVSRYEITGG